MEKSGWLRVHWRLRGETNEGRSARLASSQFLYFAELKEKLIEVFGLQTFTACEFRVL
jgi:hypothetical protein